VKKRYDAVIIGGGLAGYSLAALASREGHVLFFEHDAEPTEPPWARPMLATGEGSVWDAFSARLPLELPPPSPLRLQTLNGRHRDNGDVAPGGIVTDAEAFDTQSWLTNQLKIPTLADWFKDLFSAEVANPAIPADPWLSHPGGFASSDRGVLRYLEARAANQQSPGGDLVGLLRALRGFALHEGAEFLPASRLDAIVSGQGVRVSGLGATLQAPRLAICIDVGEWTRIPGIGKLPRQVFRRVRSQGVRVRATWACADEELPVGLAGRGWWADGGGAFYELTGSGSECFLHVWTLVQGGAEVDGARVAGELHAVIRQYCPFFRGKADAARVQVTPVWPSRHRKGLGVAPKLGKDLTYAGPQSFPGWGAEGELAAALRTFQAWFPPVAKDAKELLSPLSR
jgi:hypothetical protein